MTPTIHNPPPKASAPPAAGSASGRPSSSARQTLSIVVAHDEADLRPHLPAWEHLAAQTIEPNVFYEPWMLLPAMRHLRGKTDLHLILVFSADPGAPGHPPELCGLFPLERRSRLKGLPVASYRMWEHPHCFLCTPLLKPGVATACLHALLDRVADDGCGVMEFNDVAADGPFHQALVDCLNLRQSLTFVQDAHTRAILRPREDADAYLRAAISGEDRRAQARRARRLGETGRLDVAPLGPTDDVTAWIDQFLQLEAAGWKGQQGTALACEPAGRAFLHDVAANAAHRRRLLGLQMRLDGRPVAQRISFASAAGAFSFKTAFDERYKQCSPGALLEIENIRHVHSIPQLRWMDSCTTPDNPLINRFWIDRRTIQSIAVATGAGFGGLAVSVLPVLRWLNRAVLRRGLST